MAVIGLPDARLGEIAAAIIEVKEGLSCTEDEINTFCKELPARSLDQNPVGNSCSRGTAALYLQVCPKVRRGKPWILQSSSSYLLYSSV